MNARRFWLSFSLSASATLLALAWRRARQLTHPPRRVTPLTPRDFQLPYQEVRFPSRDGLCLHGWFVPAADARGTIVLAHGYGGDKAPDLEYVPMLRENGYNVMLFDYRAHGESEGNHATLGDQERRDLLGALDWLAQRGITSVAIMAFSGGGSISLLTAPETNNIVGVITDSTFARLPAVVLQQARKAHLPDILSRPYVGLVLALGSLQTGTDLFRVAPERAIGRIAPRPVLIIHGGRDSDIPVEQAHRLYAAAGEPKDLWIVPEAEHRAIDDLEPEEYRRRVLAFFDRLFPAPSGAGHAS